MKRSRIEKVTRGAGALATALAVAGIGAVAAAGPAQAAPAARKAVTAPLTTLVGHPRTGAHGRSTGVLVKASPRLAAYWSRYSRSARNIVVSRPAHLSRGAHNRVEGPQGRAVRIGGATGAIAKLRPLHLAPLYGSTGEPWYGPSNQAPATTTWKVFFTDHTGGHWVCSGSLVNSAGQDLVITAGHCVYGTAGGELPAGETWHSNWVFAPDYSNGNAPYGYWTARQMWTLTNYMNNDDEQDDLGAVLLNTNPNGDGVKAVQLLGGQGIAWNESSSQFVYDLGYPAESPFNGQTLQYCTNDMGWGWFDSMEFLPCNFTGGSSGGPWLMDFGGNWGYVNSVNDANGYFFYPGQMGGLYFGNNAMNLYQTVESL